MSYEILVFREEGSRVEFGWERFFIKSSFFGFILEDGFKYGFYKSFIGFFSREVCFCGYISSGFFLVV